MRAAGPPWGHFAAHRSLILRQRLQGFRGGQKCVDTYAHRGVAAAEVRGCDAGRRTASGVASQPIAASYLGSGYRFFKGTKKCMDTYTSGQNARIPATP